MDNILHKLSFDYLRDVDEFNETLNIYIDGKKMISEPLMIESGRHEIIVEQQHILNSIYFLFGTFLMVFGFFAYATESAYLFRRWGRYAVCRLSIDVNKDDTVKIRIHRLKSWFLSDRYQITIQYKDTKSEKSVEKRSVYTILGTITFILLPALIVYGIVSIAN